MAVVRSKNAIRVVDLDKALLELSEFVRQVTLKTKKGMIKAGLRIQRGAQRLCPIDTGNLRSSAFTIWSGRGTVRAEFQGKDAGRMAVQHAVVVQSEQNQLSRSDLKPEVEVGFSAYYALFVHEDTEVSHMKKNEQGESVAIGEAKFLAKAIVRNMANIQRDILEEAA